MCMNNKKIAGLFNSLFTIYRHRNIKPIRLFCSDLGLIIKHAFDLSYVSIFVF